MEVGPLRYGVGLLRTLIVWLAVLVHPFSSVTITVYKLVEEGDTVMSWPCCPLIGQLYWIPVADCAYKETCWPLQMSVNELMVTSGNGFTMTVSEVEAEQPWALVTVTK